MRLGMGILLASFLFTTSALAWDVAEMNNTIDQTNFMVNDGCSGTLIDAERGYILTAHHCVTAQYETLEREVVDSEGIVKKEKYRHMIPGTVSQYTFDGAEKVQTVVYKTKIKAMSEDYDLALLQVVSKLPNKIEAPIACKDPVRGDKAYVVGNPMGVLYSSVTVGIVSSVQREYDTFGIDENKGPLLQISSGVVGGNSGGAAYNDKGELIGVPVRASRMNEIIGLAAPVGIVKKFLSDNSAEDVYKKRCP